MALQETTQQEVHGQFTTAEVTHILEGLRLEGQCYIKNHLLMKLSGMKGALHEWHDEVTKNNLDRLIPLAKDMGIALPFPKTLEDRENEIKAKFEGSNVIGVLTEGEALAEVKATAVHLLDYYTVSMGLATHDNVRDAFRRGFENVADNLPRIEQALKQTDQFYPPPIAKQVGLVNEKRVQTRK